jgi:predicted CxxxxCH...CXXCH cytochrome family protein
MAERRGLRLRLCLALFGAAAIGPDCLERRSEPREQSNETRCATCHGDPERAGDYLLRAAPPRDLLGAEGTEYPGVGAHSIHLYASTTHGAVPCAECHRVPERTDSPGHADSDRPAELVFGSIARHGQRSPTYDAVARTCSDSWCHREADAVWTEPRTSDAACGSCHGLPPPLPHPQSSRCATCHGEVVNADRTFRDPNLHVDGSIEAQPGDCNSCHGDADSPAPPRDAQGNDSIGAIGVGAHRAHLFSRIGRSLECKECHKVPQSAAEPGHIEGVTARVTITGIARNQQHQPSWQRDSQTCNDSYCHGPTASDPKSSPKWTSSVDITCSSCHGFPPPAPHPQMKNCSHCHASVIASDDLTIEFPARHVDGVVEVEFDHGCASCHGGDNPAPPSDTQGHTDTSFLGVGAHQAHLHPGKRARAVRCNECHRVPQAVLDPGHIDSELPAEVRFAGVALAFEAEPAYRAGSCAGTPCHGAKLSGDHESGAKNPTPIWTRVDGSQSACGGCHGLPPPRPHPYQSNCSQCHEDVASDNLSFTRPELHVDGVVTFTLP